GVVLNRGNVQAQNRRDTGQPIPLKHRGLLSMEKKGVRRRATQTLPHLKRAASCAAHRRRQSGYSLEPTVTSVSHFHPVRMHTRFSIENPSECLVVAGVAKHLLHHEAELPGFATCR